jgi:predicted transcriptional regulator
MPAPRLPRALTGRLTERGHPEEWFLGALQAEILQILAARGPSTVREILEALPRRREARAYTTVMTVLVKLHAKGIVERRREGKGFTYTARFTPEELRDRMAKYLVDELVDDFGETALAHFASALDRLDRVRLRKLLGR